MGMARVPAVDPRKLGFFSRLFIRFTYFVTRRRLGKVVEPLMIAAHRPRLVFGLGMMETSFDKLRAMPAALKSLGQVRAATLVGCPF